MALYKTSDKNDKPNMSVFMTLVRNYGPKSSQVQAYMDRYASDSGFMIQATSVIESIERSSIGEKDESSEHSN